MERSPAIPSLPEIEAAALRIAPILLPTPLLPARALSERAFFLKPENLQRTGSFKIRGAYHKLERLGPAARSRGVIAYSSGNHGQAVACAAQLLGCTATIVMPEDGVAEKRAGVRAYGAEIELVPGGSNERRRVAEGRARAEGLCLVPSYDDLEIVTGQGSVGLEIARPMPDVEQVLVPVGGGGLLSGVAIAIRALAPRARVVGVEPAGADDLYRSLQSGKLVSLEEVNTAADGLRTQSVGELNFRILRDHVDEVVRVTEDEIADAVRTLLWREKLVVEPSGAVTYAAFLAGRVDQALRTVAVLSGGNISRDYLRTSLDGP